MRSCHHIINVLHRSYRVALLASARSPARASGRVNSLAAFFRHIISDDKKEKRRIRERVNDSDPQGVAAIKILRSRVTLHAMKRRAALPPIASTGMLSLLREADERYIFIGQRPIMADDADNGLAGPQDFDRRALTSGNNISKIVTLDDFASCLNLER